MRFEWDETKDALNQRQHGVEFSLAAQAVLDPNRLEWFDLDHSDQEDRWTIIGMAGSVAVILRVTISEREDGEIIRLISARKASPAQRRLYLSHRRRTP
jgi:uncharacterized DUF497 family protein